MNSLPNRPELNEAVYLARPSVSARVPAARGGRRNFAVFAVAGSCAAVATALAIAYTGGALQGGPSATGEEQASASMKVQAEEAAKVPADGSAARAARRSRLAAADGAGGTRQDEGADSRTLDRDSLRWGAGTEASAPLDAQKARAVAQSVLADRLEGGTGGGEAAAADPSDDKLATAAIEAKAGEATVVVAETEAEVAALEESMSDSVPQGVVADEPEPESVLASPEAFDRPMVQAYATEHVNMRYGPDKDTGVVTVVPKHARVQTASDCEHWCAVVYDGKRGWIYKSYIGSEGGQAQRADPQPAASDADTSEAQAAPAGADTSEEAQPPDPFMVLQNRR